MPDYVITAPDGRRFKVSGQGSKEGALAAVRARQTKSEAAESSEQPNVGLDILKSFGSGVARGASAVAGLPGDVSNLMGAGIGAARDYLVGDVSPEQRAAVTATREGGNILPTTEGIMSTASDITGMTLPEPETTAGEYARTVGEFAPAALGGGGAVARIARVLGPGLGSEAAGQATEGTAAEPYARVAGALGGAIAPSVIGRAITPFPTSQARQQTVGALKKEGVDLTAGQATGRRGLKYFESEMGGGAAAKFMEKQGEQFTKAALKRAGINASKATPDVLDDAFVKIGNQFDDLAARNQLAPVNTKLADDLVGPDGVLTVYKSLGGEAPVIESTILDIGKRLSTNHVLTGEYYKSTTSRLARFARTAKDPELREALHGIRNSLDDAMEQSIAIRNPADLGAWKDARKQYKNILVIEKAATGAGEAAAEGIISPSALRNATVNQGRRAYARGQGDFAELARAGEATMKPLPQSGTAPRVRAQNLGVGLSTLMGAGVGGAAGGGMGGAAGALIGGLLPPLAGRAALSGPGRALLSNQAMSPILQRLTPGQAAVSSALLGTQGQLALPR